MSIDEPRCLHQSTAVVLRCQGVDFRISDTACRQSSLLAATLGKQSEEDVDEIIRVESFDSDVVRSMVDFLCSGSYPADEVNEGEPNETLAGQPQQIPGKSTVEGPMSSQRLSRPFQPSCSVAQDIQVFVRHIHLNGIASHFGIPALASLSRSRLYTALKSATWPTHVLPRLLAEVFRATDDKRMSVLMASVAMEHMEALLKMTEFVDLDFPHSFLLDVMSDAAWRIRRAEFQRQTEVIRSSQARRG